MTNLAILSEENTEREIPYVEGNRIIIAGYIMGDTHRKFRVNKTFLPNDEYDKVKKIAEFKNFLVTEEENTYLFEKKT